MDGLMVGVATVVFVILLAPRLGWDAAPGLGWVRGAGLWFGAAIALPHFAAIEGEPGFLVASGLSALLGVALLVLGVLRFRFVSDRP